MSHSEHSSDVEEEYTTEDVSVPTDPSCLDLSSLFAPVSRTDLEVLLVKLIMKHQEEAGWIVEVRKKIYALTKQITENGHNRYRY